MRTDKVLKDLLKSRMLTKEIILNCIINYEKRIKEVKSQITKYQKYEYENPEYQIYIERYKMEFEDLIIRKKTLLMVFNPRYIINFKDKYYLAFKENLKSNDIVLFCRVYKKELFMYSNLKRYSNRVYSKSYDHDEYTMNFCNKVFDLINNGKYEII